MAIDLIVQHVHSQLEEVSHSWPRSHTPQPHLPLPRATCPSSPIFTGQGQLGSLRECGPCRDGYSLSLPALLGDWGFGTRSLVPKILEGHTPQAGHGGHPSLGLASQWGA